jgi:hypothetical protein
LTACGLVDIVLDGPAAVVMKRLVICVLLSVMPFASVRVVCFNPDTAARQVAALRQQAAAAQDECERVCSRAAHRVQPPTPRPTCALVADPTCGFLVDATVAVMPAAMPSTTAALITSVDPITHDSYAAPSITRLTPPPRA